MDNIGKVNTMSPLTWAYIGDAVYELYIRNYLIETTNLKPNKLSINPSNSDINIDTLLFWVYLLR